MKKYIKELVILLLQLFMFYIFPLFAGPTDAMGMVVLIIAATFVLAVALGCARRGVEKLIWPAAVAILFLPSLPLYYNFSAMIHALWYLVVAAAGLVLGSTIGWLWRKLTHQS